jgi:hypothetical protein
MLEMLLDVLLVLLCVGIFALAGWSLLSSEDGREY